MAPLDAFASRRRDRPLARLRELMSGLVAAICAVGVLLTVLATWSAIHADHNTEQRLLATQTRQAGTVLTGAADSFQQTLSTALEVETAVSPAQGAAAFHRQFAPNVGPGLVFVSASIWRRHDGRLTRVAKLGSASYLDPRGKRIRTVLRRALRSKTTLVDRVIKGGMTRISFALADRRNGLVIYGERQIPRNHRSAYDKNSAFNDLDYAIYLGATVTPSTLIATDEPPSALPLSGMTAQTTLPFGDQQLIMVGHPHRHLGGTLSQRLPLIFLIGGLLITAGAAYVADKLVRARRRADQDTATIRRLYDRVDAHFGAQRELFERLQRALLPQVNPNIPGVELASQYVAGASGIDIGGDWYSAIGFGEEHFAFVVGDVSGHGIDAVAEMARARFTLRAYLLDGNSPQAVLEKASRQFDISHDGHIVTALVGVGNWRTGEITIANAGHPLPLLSDDEGTRFVPMPVGAPLGVGADSYESAAFRMAPGSTLIAFTDGLVERRREDPDTGLRRLVDVVTPHLEEPLPLMVTRMLAGMRHADATDDVAVLALRRSGVWVRLDGESSSPSRARAFVRDHLADRALPPGVAIDDVVLVASELVTNSVRAGARVIDIDVRVDHRRLELVVEDDAEGWPRRAQADESAGGGRGLSIVEQLSDRWSVDRRPRGKWVTAVWSGDTSSSDSPA